ncbi:MAG: T9SS type A sorting domain-containing protein [Bacteroidia bacterium]
MKKLLLSISFLLLNGVMAIGQTATDFTANDCSGTSHHLFAELDAGRIIVVAFVEPCGTCVGPTQNAMYTVQSYGTSYPGKVFFYLSDDVANTPCSTLNSWAATNGMHASALFSDPAFVETQYGTIAMPKIIALAGPSHQVIFSQDNGLNVTNLQNAINAALVTGVQNVSNNGFQLSIFPNPASDNISVSYNLNQSASVNFEVYNVVGAKVKTMAAANQASGHHDLNINFNGMLSTGIYLLKLNANGVSEVLKFSITK